MVDANRQCNTCAHHARAHGISDWTKAGLACESPDCDCDSFVPGSTDIYRYHRHSVVTHSYHIEVPVAFSTISAAYNDAHDDWRAIFGTYPPDGAIQVRTDEDSVALFFVEDFKHFQGR